MHVGEMIRAQVQPVRFSPVGTRELLATVAGPVDKRLQPPHSWAVPDDDQQRALATHACCCCSRHEKGGASGRGRCAKAPARFAKVLRFCFPADVHGGAALSPVQSVAAVPICPRGVQASIDQAGVFWFGLDFCDSLVFLLERPRLR